MSQASVSATSGIAPLAAHRPGSVLRLSVAQALAGMRVHSRNGFVVFGMMVLGSLGSGGLLTAYGWNTVIWVSFLPWAVAVAALAFRASSRSRFSEAG